MNKQEMAGYLANLISIMESKEDAGISRGRTLADEYNKTYNEFRELLDKEKDYYETGSSEQQSERTEERTDLSRREPRSG